MMSAIPGPQPAAPATFPTVRPIPGGYGWPLLGPMKDRLDYFWFQGPKKFFQTRIERNRSTVFRTNVPPSFPFFLGVNPNVIAVLDVKSFSHLFDPEVAEKANVLVGDFMPSVSFTGGMRVCAYLDTSEPKHAQIKNYTLDILKRSSATWVQALTSQLDVMWSAIDSDLSKSGGRSASLLLPLQKFLFSFFSLTLLGADVSKSPEIARSGHIILDKWLGLQLLPTINVGYLQPLEEIFLHSFPYPFFLVKRDYQKIVDFVEKEAAEAVRRGVDGFGLTQKEAVHNLVFVLGFNAVGGFSIFLPALLGALGDEKNAGYIQGRLRKEVREVAGTHPENLSFEKVKEMGLVQSFVYETLRLNPPVPTQFARARKDFQLSSHESSYEVKKGELLCGYQPLVMRDPKVFYDPETFVLDRFAGEKGKELLKYLYWSNGPQTGSPGPADKQCAGKEIVTLTASLLVAYILQRYDSITVASASVKAAKRAVT
ncbi:unnamed protein product [Cuscuta campestris]|uniref:Uncharacterized protein n=1 Tax=Cuscuta campestris TaxID=132261 RepID=A0A484KGM4_9ASTE|nr:unnamed protein product [Cuscuta campestris]